jgi:hypothetical protein
MIKRARRSGLTPAAMPYSWFGDQLVAVRRKQYLEGLLFNASFGRRV